MEKCQWVYAGWDMGWDSGCGQLYDPEIDPDINNFKFCPECGLELEIVEKDPSPNFEPPEDKTYTMEFNYVDNPAN